MKNIKMNIALNIICIALVFISEGCTVRQKEVQPIHEDTKQEDSIIEYDYGILTPEQGNIEYIKEKKDSIFLYNKLYKKRKFLLAKTLDITDDFKTENLDTDTFNTRVEAIGYPFTLESKNSVFFPSEPDLKYTSFPPYITLNGTEHIKLPLKYLIDRYIYSIISFEIYKFLDEEFVLFYLGSFPDDEAILLKLSKGKRLDLIPFPVANKRRSDFTLEDYNDDGILDYAPIVGDSIVQFYSLEGNEFKLNEKYKVSLSLRKHTSYYINEEKTNWFGEGGKVFVPDWLK